MNRKDFLRNISIAVLVPSVLLAACVDKKTNTAAGSKEQTYTCPMHPQIVQNKPGTCPICGMDLIPFDKSSPADVLTLGASQQALANITTITIGTNEFSSFTQLNGRLTINPEQTTYVSSRVPGRIEVLYIKETGVRIIKGQPLYKIYSEQLSTLQQEYMLMADQAASFPGDQRFQQMEKAARQKLLLYGQTEAQLSALVRSKKTDPFVTYFAPESGVVAELSIAEGQYVPEGGTIMKLEAYNQLWVEADVYPSEADKVKTGQQVKVIVAGYEDRPQAMTISFITPSLQAGSQVMQIRGTIPNPNNQWQPGLQAIVLLSSTNKGKALTLPMDAVIRDGNGAHVWVEKDKNKFQSKMVTTGMENFDQVEITSGLEEGEKVVVTGAYLLTSEFVLKKGKNPMAGHNH
ncbi:efflux RND transporter periplasmic adaptor subunit [Chitinophagaceae bacterium LB-8]|uniref:Efflux RND transporter periplasmic adaptor subunit n=1 Tax=Paraflavisolibacter caeni TaxID=2982496 RepID=A0A9X3BH26_9BACT|nr:efflux RND transporter periplasmic adaptor subunit [Paraflavisolibacter caeni]MCU7551844.1 efflux RND transporter periplasmic adaptor subunit [Paraflavisolibacter caeni]